MDKTFTCRGISIKGLPTRSNVLPTKVMLTVLEYDPATKTLAWSRQWQDLAPTDGQRL